MELKKHTGIPTLALLWLEQELKLDDQEFTELCSLQELIEAYSSMQIPHSVLPRKKIDLKKSSLVRKLISHGFCTLSQTDIEIRHKLVSEADKSDFMEYLNKQYREIIGSGNSPFPPFPSPIFTDLNIEVISIHFEDLASYNPRRLARTDAVIQIHFGEKALPDILCNATSYPLLKDACILKIREHLAILAGENSDFYSNKIKTYKNSLKGRNAEIIEMEIGKLKTRTEKQTREDITRIVFNQMTKSEDNFLYTMSDVMSTDNSYILTRFSMENRGDFDFFQAAFIIQNAFSGSRQHHSVNNSSLLQAVKQSLSGFVTSRELKEQALKANPELRPEEYDQIYSSFEQSHVGLGTKLPMPLILKQNIPRGNSVDEYLVHIANINNFLETRVVKAAEEIGSELYAEWMEKLGKHQFDEAMFDDFVFRRHLAFHLEKDFFTLFCFVRNMQLNVFLESAGILSPRIRALGEHGLDKPEIWLEISRTELQARVQENLNRTHSGIGGLLFRFVHWLAQYIYLKRPEKERKKQSVPERPAEQIPKPKPRTEETAKAPHKLLALCKCSNEAQLREKTRQLWAHIPEKTLQRDDVEQNITRDLNSFFTDKELVYFSSLDFITETNLNRILSRGPHLIAYSASLKEYIEHQLCYAIYVDSFMRNKIRFKPNE